MKTFIHGNNLGTCVWRNYANVMLFFVYWKSISK